MHEVAVTRVNSWSIVPVIRTDLHWLVRTLYIFWLLLASLAWTKFWSHGLSTWLPVDWPCNLHWFLLL